MQSSNDNPPRPAYPVPAGRLFGVLGPGDELTFYDRELESRRLECAPPTRARTEDDA